MVIPIRGIIACFNHKHNLCIKGHLKWKIRRYIVIQNNRILHLEINLGKNARL